jgi:hypothetical protein
MTARARRSKSIYLCVKRNSACASCCSHSVAVVLEQRSNAVHRSSSTASNRSSNTAHRWWGHSLFIIAGRGHAQHSGGGGGMSCACHPRCSSHMTAASMVPCMSSALIASRRFTWHAAITNSMAGANGSSCLRVRGGDGGSGCRLCT